MSICGLLDKTIGKAISYFEQIDLMNAINIFDVEDDCVWLDLSGKTKLYLVKLEGDSNRKKEFVNFEHLVKESKYSNGSEVFVSFVSRKLHKATYVFAYSKEVISSISSSFGVAPASGEDVLEAIYDMYLSTNYTVNRDNKQVKTGIEGKSVVPSSLEVVNGKFKAKMQLAAMKNSKECTFYQASDFSDKTNLSIVDLFRINWEGTFTIRFDFRVNAVKFIIKNFRNVAKFGDKEFGNICDSILKEEDKRLVEDIENSVCVSNAVLFLKDESRDKLSSISSTLGINFLENYLTGTKILSRTLFLSRDADFDALVKTDVAKKFFVTAKKKQIPDNLKTYFWGEDISGDYVDYNFKDASNSPHSMIIGRNGSGKSRQAIRMIEQIIGLNENKTAAHRLGEVKIRYADVGYTSGRLLEAVSIAHPDRVQATEARIDELRFSLFDLPVVNGAVPTVEMDYLIGIVNFAIETKEHPPLNGIEEDFFRNIVEKTIVNKKYNNIPISVFAEKLGYSKLFEELISKGYSEKSQLSDLSDEYDFLKKPVLGDIVSEIGIEKNISTHGEEDRRFLDTLSTKLKIINSYSFLNFHGNTKDNEDKDFFHIDFDSLKETPASFCVIYWLIMKKWIRMLKESAKKRLAKQEEPIDVFFIVEEAHNFFEYAIFSKMLITASKELRKYGGKLVFITQQLKDIPEKISKEIGTKIFVAPPSEKALLKHDIETVFRSVDKGDMDVLDHTTDYMMYIMYDKGSIGCKFLYEGDVEWFYKPYAPSF